jgi:hypothetical protein
MLKFFGADPDPVPFDPGSGTRDKKIRIRDKHPGSPTLQINFLEPYPLTLMHPLSLGPTSKHKISKLLNGARMTLLLSH